MASRANRKQFLDALFADYYSSHRGYILVRSSTDWMTETNPLFFFSTDLLAKQVFDAGRNVCFGVCPRERMMAGKKDIRYLTALWANVDFGVEGHSRTSCFEDSSLAIKAVQEFPREASIIVNSGRGMHLYWLLERPHQVVDPRQVERVLTGICLRLGCQPLAPIDSELRLPETVNNKIDGKPVRCYVEQLNPDVRYALEDFEDLDRHVAPRPQRRKSRIFSRPGPVDLQEPDREIPSFIQRARADLWSLLGDETRSGSSQRSSVPSAGDETVAMTTEDLPRPVPRHGVPRGVEDLLPDEPTLAMTTEDLPMPYLRDEVSREADDLVSDEPSPAMTTEDLPIPVPGRGPSRAKEDLSPDDRTQAPDDYWALLGPSTESDSPQTHGETDTPTPTEDSWDSDFTGRGYGYSGDDAWDFDPDTHTGEVAESAEQRLARDLASGELTILVDADSGVVNDSRTPAVETAASTDEIARDSSSPRPGSESEPHPEEWETRSFDGLDEIGALARELSPATLLAQEGLRTAVPDEPPHPVAVPDVPESRPEKGTAPTGFLGRLRNKLANLRSAKNDGKTDNDVSARVSPEVPRTTERGGLSEQAPVMGQAVGLRSGTTQCGLFVPGTRLPATWTAVIQPGRTFAGRPLEFYVGSKQVGLVRLPEAWRTSAHTGKLELSVTCRTDFMHVRLRNKRSGWERTYRFPMKIRS